MKKAELTHPYLQHARIVSRLVHEWQTYGKLVIAYDYDNTVYDYHGDGDNYDDIIELLRDCHDFGAHLIVFTAASSDRHEGIKEYLRSKEIPFDGINENAPGLPFTLGSMGQKIYFNILLDDRAGLESAYHALKEVLLVMKGEA